MVGRFGHLATWPMVGRDEELRFVGQRLAAGSSGVLITGPMGTGKSRLAREARRAAADAGRVAHAVVCTRATADLPYAALASLYPTETEGDRFSLILDGLRREPEPVVLCIDDIDRLDRRSSAVVHQALVEGLVSVLATARNDVGLSDELVTLWKDLDVTRVEIQALSRGEVRAMVEAGIGGTVDSVALKSIWSTAAGVPLYVRELVLEAIARGVLVDDRGVWQLTGPLPNPESLTELVGLRLDALSPDAHAAADVIGIAEGLPTDLLVEMSGRAAIGELETHGIVEADGDDHRLSHPLFGEVVRATMTIDRRHGVMSDLADALERRGLHGDDDIIRVAAWRLATGVADTPAATGAAAHAAYRARDFDLARRLAQAAFEHDDAEAGLLLGQIAHEAGEHVEAERINVGMAEALDDPGLTARAAVQRAVNLFFGLGRGAAALDVLAASPDGAPLNRAWFLVNMSRIDDARGALPADHPEQRSVVVTQAWIDALGGRPERAATVADRLAAAGEHTVVAPSRFRDFPTIPQALGLLESGRLDAALAVATAGHDASVDHHPDFIRAWWLFLLARIHADAGRLLTAASLFRQGEVLQHRLAQPGLMRWFVGGAALALAQTSDADDVDHLLATCDRIADRDEQAFGFLVEGARSWQRWRGGDHDGAIDELVDAGDRAAALGAHTAARRLWFDAVRLGGVERLDGRLGVEDAATELDLARAGLAAAGTDGDASAATEAAERFERLGAHLWAGEAWATAARLLAADGEGRRATAAAREAREARDRCEAADTPGLVVTTDVAPLTDREREVVTMAARGTASREIAEQLVVSLRTVNNLIQRAYGKLGVSSRAEAAAALGIEPPRRR